ncbi:MAG: endolytic transglycosylase MltG [Parcubacteria group bacterium]
MPEEKNLLKTQIERIKIYLFEQKMNKKKVAIVFGVALVILFTYVFLNQPPKNFPLGSIVTITRGESLQTIAENLYRTGAIRYPAVFRIHVILLGGERRVIAGDYLLNKKDGPGVLAYRLVEGQFRLDVAKVTIPEGWNVFQIADYLEKSLINFNKESFVDVAKKDEGYLFPDTYFVPLIARPNTIIGLMKGTFKDKIESVPGLANSSHSLEEIITMASILEGEAVTEESRRIVAGILWNRISRGIPLQVDSTFSYVNGKNTYELTLKDLKIDSPYNTYKYKGLPPGPINNPGLDSITAALNPIATDYLYFLSSKSGKMYYAKTFEEHKRNKELYLNK